MLGVRERLAGEPPQERVLGLGLIGHRNCNFGTLTENRRKRLTVSEEIEVTVAESSQCEGNDRSLGCENS